MLLSFYQIRIFVPASFCTFPSSDLEPLFLQGGLIPCGSHTLCGIRHLFGKDRCAGGWGSQADLRAVDSSPQHADALFTLLWLQHPMRGHVPPPLCSGIITVACPHRDALLTPTLTPGSVSPLCATVAFFLLLAPPHGFWPKLFRKAKEGKGKKKREKKWSGEKSKKEAKEEEKNERFGEKNNRAIQFKEILRVCIQGSSVQFSSVQSLSRVWLFVTPWQQHARPPCPSPTPGVYSNPFPSSRWCHPTISSSVVPFSSCPQSFPASGSSQVSQLFTSGGQSIRVSASASVLPMNT